MRRGTIIVVSLPGEPFVMHAAQPVVSDSTAAAAGIKTRHIFHPTLLSNSPTCEKSIPPSCLTRSKHTITAEAIFADVMSKRREAENFPAA